MIKLELNLPEPYDLVSIQKMYNGKWAVCVCDRPVAGALGYHYALADHTDLEEALRLALERSEAKKNAPPVIVPKKKADTIDLPPDLDLDL